MIDDSFSDEEWTSPGFDVIERSQTLSGRNEKTSAVTLLSAENKELGNLVSNWDLDMGGPQKLRITSWIVTFSRKAEAISLRQPCLFMSVTISGTKE